MHNTENLSEDLNAHLAGLMDSDRQRASKNSFPNYDTMTRTQARDMVIDRLLLGEITQGEALKILRVQVLDIKQDKFAQMVKVSRKTVSDIENNRGNYSVETLNQIFRPFGLKVGLVRIKK